MTSEEENDFQKTITDKRDKRFTKVGAKLSLKTKRSDFIVNKLKLKSKSVTESSNLPSGSGTEDYLKETNTHISSTLERQAPEDDDNFTLTKSASETNLKESLVRSRGISQDKGKAATESAKNISKPDQSVENKGAERTKSLQNLEDMLRHGQVVMEETAETVTD